MITVAMSETTETALREVLDAFRDLDVPSVIRLEADETIERGVRALESIADSLSMLARR